MIAGIAVITVILSSCHNLLGPGSVDYHNKILFTSSRSGTPQLYMMNPDGSGVQQLTTGPYSHYDGRWSPDAKRIVCQTNQDWTTAGVHMLVSDANGTNQHLLAYGSSMAWSPDGHRILFWYCPSCELGIIEPALYVVDPDSGNPERLPVDGGNPSWSPNGDVIAFNSVSLIDSIPHAHLAIMDYPDYERVRLIGPSGADEPAWSPTGREIAFEMDTPGSTVSEIFSADTATGDIRQITSHKSAEAFLYPRWSPDGSKLVFISHTVDGRQNWYIYIVNIDGSDLHRIISDSTVTSADWSE